jgi:hypothetical protein
VQCVRWRRAIGDGDGDGALLAGDRQVQRVRRIALPYLILPLWPEPLLLERDEQPVRAGGVQVVDLLGGESPAFSQQAEPRYC